MSTKAEVTSLPLGFDNKRWLVHAMNQVWYALKCGDSGEPVFVVVHRHVHAVAGVGYSCPSTLEFVQDVFLLPKTGIYLQEEGLLRSDVFLAVSVHQHEDLAKNGPPYS